MEKALISELTQGMELVRQLGFSLHSLPLLDKTHHQLLQRILSNYEKCLFILQLGNNNIVGPTQHPTVTHVVPAPETCSSPEASPRSDDVVSVDRATTELIHASKRRKGQPVWTNQVRIRTENGLEGQIGDGYSWRKYGQKDILGAKYPRSYYRCTYRSIHDCWATKYLQRSDEDPYVFQITYRGNHKCDEPHRSTAIQQTHVNNNTDDDSLEKLKANLRVNVDHDHISGGDHFSFPSAIVSSGLYNSKPDNNFSFSSIDDGNLSRVLSPSIYFSQTQREISNCAQNSESNPTTSLDFSLEGLDHGQEQQGNIQFDNTGLFGSYEKH